MSRRTVVLVVLVVAGALAALLARRDGDFDLPARIRVEEPVADLLAAPPDEPARLGGLVPGREEEPQGRYRRALLVPPPSRLGFRTRIPARARLYLGVAVAGDGKRDPEAAGVRFTVDVDGRRVFTRVVNPARRRADRRWFDADVALPDGEREVEIVLATEREGTGPRLAGTPGWGPVRVVREASQDRQAASRDAPSVLVLLVDTLRADQLGCYGAAPSVTPTTDRLARDALVFDRMIAPASWTLPSVATYLTGLHPRSHGVQGRSDEGDGAATDGAFLSDALVTLPELAQRAGITTVGVSANPLVARATNFTRGFETFVEGGWERERSTWLPAKEVNATFLRWLARNRGHRFLAYLHYMEPHDPYTPSARERPVPPPSMPEELVAGRVERVSQKIRTGRQEPLPAAQIAHLRALYALEVGDWDAALAELLAGLDAAGVRGSTAVVVLGDHGEEFQEHGQLKHRIHLYDELLHVPFIVAGPGVAAGRAREQVQGVDVFPTLAGLLGIPPPTGLPGQDLRAPHEPRPAFSETRGGILPDGRRAALVSVRTERWKLIEAPALGHVELYDLVRDPGETDARGEPAGDGAALKAALAAWQASAPPPPAVAGRDPALDRKLRALGYVE